MCEMTEERAVVLWLINRYLVPGFDYPISLLELQKLVYFLTEAGEELNQVKFVKHHYGPYAPAARLSGRLPRHWAWPTHRGQFGKTWRPSRPWA